MVVPGIEPRPLNLQPGSLTSRPQRLSRVAPNISKAYLRKNVLLRELRRGIVDNDSWLLYMIRHNIWGIVDNGSWLLYMIRHNIWGIVDNDSWLLYIIRHNVWGIIGNGSWLSCSYMLKHNVSENESVSGLM
jgi:hypothetical protein